MRNFGLDSVLKSFEERVCERKSCNGNEKMNTGQYFLTEKLNDRKKNREIEMSGI